MSAAAPAGMTSSDERHYVVDGKFVHRLKCWSESFDAILEGKKRAEVRAEEDRKFKAGDMLELTRTDRDGNVIEPRVRLIIDVTHVERHCGPLELVGVRLGETGSSATAALAILSLANRGAKLTDEAGK